MMKEETIVAGGEMQDCCKVLADRVTTQVQPDLAVSVCQTCGRRHFELTVDPVKLGALGASM